MRKLNAMLTPLIRQAADYYLQVKASAPAGTTISFTGHSLGGGLASLMAVLFGETAFTFDQAPFRNAALPFNLIDQDGNTIYNSAALDLRAYLAANAAGFDSTALAELLAPLDADIGANWPGNKTVGQLDAAIASQYLNGDQSARSFLSQDNYWSIQSGADALNAVGTGTNNDAMIGGTTNDTLDGGAGNDFLYGGDGNYLDGGAVRLEWKECKAANDAEGRMAA